MKRVIVVSPYRGNWLRRLGHINYAREAVRDCLLRGEAPLAGHLLYTQRGILKDHIAAERGMGIEANAAWMARADAVVVYADLGVSDGMSADIAAANVAEVPVLYRYIRGPEPALSGDIFRNFGGLM